MVSILGDLGYSRCSLSSRAILHDEDRYPGAYKFDPTRFLKTDGTVDPDVLDPVEAFGYGRRICPGRYFAQDVLWCTIANILATFTIEKRVDGQGNVIEPKEEYTGGLFRYVKDYARRAIV